MAEAIAFYPDDWSVVRGVLVPQSILRDGRFHEWLLARSKGEVLECPEVRRVPKIINLEEATDG